jgi:HEAT repeat protein
LTKATPESPGERRRRVALAGHLGDEQAARRHVEDPDPSVRSTAFAALGRMSALRPADIGAAWADPDAAVRARAAELSIAFGPGAIPRLSAGLTDRDWRVVEASCFALGEIGAPVVADENTVEALGGVAKTHRDPLCREAAVAALGSIGSPAGLSSIIEATADKPAVRRRAVLALAPFEGPEVDAALARALEDRDWQVRQAAEDLTDRRGNQRGAPTS